LNESHDEVITLKDLELPEETIHLFRYLQKNRLILDIPNVNHKFLNIFSHMVLELIRQENHEWQKLVPNYIAHRIKERKLFGYKQF
jgi:hypothetical protein